MRSSNDMSQIKAGCIISYFTVALNILMGLVYTPWILRTVGNSDYGLYTLALSFIALFLLDFGMSAAVTRFISNFRAQGKQDCINSFVGLTVKYYIIICSIATVILTIVYFFIPQIYIGLTLEEVSKFKIVFIITALFVVISFPVNIFNGILNAYEKYVALKCADALNKLLTIITTVYILSIRPNLYILVFINGFFNFITLVLKIIFVKVKTPVKVSFAENAEVSFKKIFSFSIWATVNTISQQLIKDFMPTVLGMVANTFAISVYGFASSIEGYVYTISQGINGLFMPMVSREIVNEDDASKVLPLMIKVGRINLSIMILLFVGLISLGREFVNLWIGDEYEVLYSCILFLTLHYIFKAPQQIAVTATFVKNKIRFTSIVNFITSVVGLVVAYYIEPSAGIIGVCAVVFVSNLVKFVCCNYYYHKVMNINMTKFFINCNLNMLPASIISLILSFGFAYFVSINIGEKIGWLIFSAEVIGICFIYFIVMWIFGWNKYEKNLIKSLIPFLRQTSDYK